MSALGFKASVDPALTCCIACVQWIPQIPLSCDLNGWHCIRAFSTCASIGRIRTWDEVYGAVCTMTVRGIPARQILFLFRIRR